MHFPARGSVRDRLVFLIAAAHDPVGWGRRVYASLLALAALATVGVALRHL